MLQQHQQYIAANGLGQTASINIPYAQNMPKELGILQRVEGLTSGLSEIRDRLQNFGQRLGFDVVDPAPGGLATTPAPNGIETTLGYAEAHLRDCIGALNRLNDRF